MLSVVLATAMLHAGAVRETTSPKGVMAPVTSIPGEPPYGIVEGRYVIKGDLVCFRDPIVGSKIPTRRCMSRETFAQRRQDSKDHLDDVQRDSRLQTGF